MSNFTFSNPIHNSMKNHSYEEMENYESWADRIRGGQHNNFGKPNSVESVGAWQRRNHGEDDNDSDGTPSPELWKQNMDNPRAQSIAKYRQEMLDLVRGVPETAYELSLIDLVESPKMTAPLKEEDDEETERKGKKKEKRGGRRILRNESMDIGGLMLKMMLIPRIPSVFGGKKSNGSKKKSMAAKVSPKPVVGDREWWNEEYREMNTSSSSNSSGKRNRKLLGCYPFFKTRLSIDR